MNEAIKFYHSKSLIGSIIYRLRDWKFLTIHIEVPYDKTLFFAVVLNNFVMGWLGEYSND